MSEDQDDEGNLEFVVFATVTLRGASMTVSAKSAAEAREIADKNPDFDFNGAEMSDWVVTGVGEG